MINGCCLCIMIRFNTNIISILNKIFKNFSKLNRNEIFLLGCSDTKSTYEIARIIKELLKSKSKINRVKKTPVINQDNALNLTKLKSKLNFRPMTTKQALKCYIKEMNEKH